MSEELDLEVLVDTWRGPLTGLFAARGVDPAEAVELAQDVFAEAWIGRGRFRGDPGDPRAVGAWLAGIARNLHRARARRRRPERLEPGVAEARAARVPDPEAEAAARLREAVDALPDRERAVVKAFYFERSSTVHVAALLGISPRAVEGLLRRARTRLEVTLSSVRSR